MAGRGGPEIPPSSTSGVETGPPSGGARGARSPEVRASPSNRHHHARGGSARPAGPPWLPVYTGIDGDGRYGHMERPGALVSKP